jgi:hypothetical protein
MEKREALLQKAADEFCATAIQKGATPGGDQFAQSRQLYKSYVAGVYSGRVRPAAMSVQPTAVIDDGYAQLMAKAQLIAEREGITQAQAFARLYGAPGAVLKRGGRTIPPGDSLTDDSDEMADCGDGDMDDDEEADNINLDDPRGEPAASTAPQGSSVGDYVHGHNTAHSSRSMAGGVRSSGSYSPSRRPRSAPRRSMR